MEASEERYDQASTIFSPDGRLFQVEYAREVIKKGATAIGIKYNKGSVLLAYIDSLPVLAEPTTTEKITRIDEHIGCTFSGLVADARRLVDFARDEAQVYYQTYNEKIPVKTLINIIGEYKHLHTQFDGVRPFGVTLIIAGVDEAGNHLYGTDPSGSFFEYKAICEGKESTKIATFLDKKYKEDLTKEAALHLGLQALEKQTKKLLNYDNIEGALITDAEGFLKISYKQMRHSEK
ncbi:MAG: archaeal proteasome endopeptidase complex subunit alpha [Candidatus Thermoplasmatota archaeon]|nr:archaeal proteasome endopeptidase complex subunit alpha [Candidatus Thermoplasmatota archaeon]